MRSKISKILGFGLSAGLVFASLATIFAAPAPVAAGSLEWSTVNTPSWADMVIAPSTDILDYDIGGDGDTIYAVLDTNEICNGVGDLVNYLDLALVKSTDGGVTWSDITANVTGAANLPPGVFVSLTHVAVAPDDEDWVAVMGDFNGFPQVVASRDGGANFSYTGDMTDGGISMVVANDLAVSIEVAGIHNIAVAGMDDTPIFGAGSIFRLKAGTWLTGAWEDTSDYLGWDNGVIFTPSRLVTACAFSPNFDIDDTIVCLVQDGDTRPNVQSGVWESSGGAWNDDAGFPNATEITANGDTLYFWTIGIREGGLALPADYDGSDPSARTVFLYVDAYNDTTGLYGGYVMRCDNGAVSEPFGPPGNPLLASIDFHGDAGTGKMMIGEYYQYDNNLTYPDNFVKASCCQGVRVWHTVELDPCCPNWELACKNPSGPYMALVMYTPDGIKEYASTSGKMDEIYFSGFDPGPPGTIPYSGDIGTPLDESAFSVSRDDGVSFNQLSLIDTDIDYLSDVAVCPDCSVVYLATVNRSIVDTNTYFGDHPCLEDQCGINSKLGYCHCDSVWRSYDNGATWERVFHGEWYGTPLLRLPCDAVEDCCDQDAVSPSGTVYLGIQGTDEIFYSRDCGQCWNDPPATKITIQDFAVESENIVYVINDDGDFSMSSQYGRRWSDAVDTGVGSGHIIAACCEEGFVVVAGAGDEPVG